MSVVAEQLRQARQAQGLTVHQVADVTKIRTDHIEALEEGNYDVFSAQIYIRGFVRAYARMLKLNEAQIIAALDAELSHTKKFSAPPPLTDRPHTMVDTLTLLLSKINWKVGLIVVVVLMVLGTVAGVYGTWKHYKTNDPLAGLTPAVYQSPGASSETLPLPTSTRRP
jgi:cytoskeleton protein RodZ